MVRNNLLLWQIVLIFSFYSTDTMQIRLGYGHVNQMYTQVNVYIGGIICFVNLSPYHTYVHTYIHMYIRGTEYGSWLFPKLIYG